MNSATKLYQGNQLHIPCKNVHLSIVHGIKNVDAINSWESWLNNPRYITMLEDHASIKNCSRRMFHDIKCKMQISKEFIPLEKLKIGKTECAFLHKD